MTPDAIKSLSRVRETRDLISAAGDSLTRLHELRDRAGYDIGRDTFADLVRKASDRMANAIIDGIVMAWSDRMTAQDPRYTADPEARFYVQSNHLLNLAERITERARQVAAATREPPSHCADKSGHALPIPTDPAR